MSTRLYIELDGYIQEFSRVDTLLLMPYLRVTEGVVIGEGSAAFVLGAVIEKLLDNESLRGSLSGAALDTLSSFQYEAQYGETAFMWVG